MAESISQQVAKILKKNPNISNTDLYAKFPGTRENTLRNYKSKFKNSLSRQLSGEDTNSSPKSGTKDISLRGRVFEFFRQDPKASNQKLYEEFSDYSKNKLRHYKASFFKSLESLSEDPIAIAKSVSGQLKQRAKSSKDPLAKLEARIVQLEKQVDKLTKTIESSFSGKDLAKTSFGDKASNLEKKFRELESNLVKYIGDKRKKIKSEMSHLDDIQQGVTDKINMFINSFREKNR